MDKNIKYETIWNIGSCGSDDPRIVLGYLNDAKESRSNKYEKIIVSFDNRTGHIDVIGVLSDQDAKLKVLKRELEELEYLKAEFEPEDDEHDSRVTEKLSVVRSSLFGKIVETVKNTFK